MMDLSEPDVLDERIMRLLSHHDPLWRGLGLAPPKAADIKRELMEIAPKVLPYMAPTLSLIHI